MTAILRDTRTASVTAATEDDTPTAFDLFDFAAPGFCEAITDAGLYIEVPFVAKSGNNYASGKVGATFKVVAGALSLLGTPTEIHFDNSDLAVGGMTLAASGSKLRAVATGIDSTHVAWRFHVHPWTS